MLRGAIFDFDGTLFDSMSAWDNIGERYLRAKGYTPQENLSESLNAMSLYQASRYIKKEYGMCESVDEISDEVNKMIESAYIKTILPKNGAKDFLEQLKKKGVRMCIATATDRYLIEAALQRCAMKEYFVDIHTCSSVGSGKDEPFIFRKALQTLGTYKRETIVFEDACYAVLTAKNDSFSVAGVYDQHEDRQEDVRKACDFYMGDFTDTDAFWKFVSDF